MESKGTSTDVQSTSTLSEFKVCSDEHLELSAFPVYGTRKSSRRLLQQLTQNQTDGHLLEKCSNETLTSSHITGNQHSLPDSIESVDLLANGTNDISSSLSSTKISNTLTSSDSNQPHMMQHANHPIGSSSNQTTTTAKHQRKWEMWQADDTRWFFEALNEHGKDFNLIHHYMSVKLKKKGTAEDMMKNKEQIRCYFNRQWNKVSGLLDQSNTSLRGSFSSFLIFSCF